MATEVLSFEDLVQNEIAAVQAALPGAYTFDVGSIVRALIDADCTNALWLESLIEFTQSITRLSTSEGSYVDSFIADYGLTRPAATYASGQVTFSRNTPTLQANIPVGSTVSTFNNTVTFTVYADANYSNYDADSDSYIIPASVTSGFAPVQANTAGTVGNVVANSITVINSSIPGVDNVTNALAFTNGSDSASDAATRTYFVQYINSLSRANEGGIEYSIIIADPSIQIEYNLVENESYAGAVQLGFFYAVIDDGTGNASPNLIATVRNSINAYRGLSIAFDVYAVVVVNASVTATVTLPAGYTNDNIKPDAENAITTYINGLGIGETLYYTRIAQIIYNVIATDASSLINEINVSSILVNGGTSNIVPTKRQSVYPLTIDVTVV